MPSPRSLFACLRRVLHNNNNNKTTTTILGDGDKIILGKLSTIPPDPGAGLMDDAVTAAAALTAKQTARYGSSAGGGGAIDGGHGSAKISSGAGRTSASPGTWPRAAAGPAFCCRIC